MSAPASRAVMSLAIRCLGESRREWALAMRAEFDLAVAEGRPFAFAAGCLIAAWREMPGQAEGRLVLASYALALGVLIPMGVLQFGLVLGFSSVFGGGSAFGGTVLAGSSHNPLLVWSQLGSVPCLLFLWLSVGLAHLRLAWVLIDRDWEGATKVSALIGATLATLFIVMGVLQFDLTLLTLQAVAMAIELTALMAVARWHTRLLPTDAREMAAR